MGGTRGDDEFALRRAVWPVEHAEVGRGIRPPFLVDQLVLLVLGDLCRAALCGADRDQARLAETTGRQALGVAHHRLLDLDALGLGESLGQLGHRVRDDARVGPGDLAGAEGRLGRRQVLIEGGGEGHVARRATPTGVGQGRHPGGGRGCPTATPHLLAVGLGDQRQLGGLHASDDTVHLLHVGARDGLGLVGDLGGEPIDPTVKPRQTPAHLTGRGRQGAGAVVEVGDAAHAFIILEHMFESSDVQVYVWERADVGVSWWIVKDWSRDHAR